MVEGAPTNQARNAERFDGAQQAFDRALKNAFLTGQAYDPDGKGYAYWKAQDDAERRHDSGADPASKPIEG